MAARVDAATRRSSVVGSYTLRRTYALLNILTNIAAIIIIREMLPNNISLYPDNKASSSY